MAHKPDSTWLTDEVADFFASAPSSEEILAFRPSTRAQKRLTSLLGKSKNGSLSLNEKWELDQFEHIAMLLQSIKARPRTPRSVPS
jgi:hypothetical protein